MRLSPVHRAIAPSDPAAPAHRHDQSSDARLVRLIQERDVAALTLVYDRHAQAAFGLALRIVGERALAEEVAQEAFVSVWRNSHRYLSERGSVRSWVLGITHNRAIDALRRRGSHARLRAAEQALAEQPSGWDLTQAEVLRREDARAVRGALLTLPLEQRRAIELAYFAGLTHSEIAATLDLPLGTVKGRIRLALERLREALGPAEVAA